jgi:hypothetical protein
MNLEKGNLLMSKVQLKESRRLKKKHKHEEKRLKESRLMKKLDREEKIHNKKYFYKVKKDKDGKDMFKENGEPLVDRIPIDQIYLTSEHKDAVKRKVNKRVTEARIKKELKNAEKKKAL